ncbi:MAG: hypothetical protein EBY40_04170 [Marivivens sp.]|jgi:hypothetical protein|nr:hypothetical protein [Marivivens sp.]NDH02308.1 hypothetical protein [Marivivens sp.]
MKIEGVKKLLRQLDDLPVEVQSGLKKSIQRTVKTGVNKGKALAPVLTGDFKNGINGSFKSGEKGEIFGFINFYDGSADDGLAAASINYGWNNAAIAYNIRAQVKAIVGPRHKRAVQRQIRKAIKEALNG